MAASFFRCKPRLGRFICHVGPPKTATTAIQSALQSANGDGMRYLGTVQPRYRNKFKGIYSHLMELVRAEPSSDYVRKMKRKIGKALALGNDLIFSDEMLLINQNGASFEQKLRRLNLVLKGYPCVIIVTLREPVSALKSLYLEIYFRQEILPRISFEEFLASHQAYVFDYLYLLEIFRECQFDNVRCFSLQRGQTKLKLADFTGCPEHLQLLDISERNLTEEKFRGQLDALEVPENLSLHLHESYSHIINLS